MLKVMKKIFILIAVISLFSCEKEEIEPNIEITESSNSWKPETIILGFDTIHLDDLTCQSIGKLGNYTKVSHIEIKGDSATSYSCLGDSVTNFFKIQGDTIELGKNMNVEVHEDRMIFSLIGYKEIWKRL